VPTYDAIRHLIEMCPRLRIIEILYECQWWDMSIITLAQAEELSNLENLPESLKLVSLHFRQLPLIISNKTKREGFQIKRDKMARIEGIKKDYQQSFPMLSILFKGQTDRCIEYYKGKTTVKVCFEDENECKKEPILRFEEF